MSAIAHPKLEPPVDQTEAPIGSIPPTRLLVWSVRRELWEHRSITVAPLLVTGVVLLASLIATLGLPAKMRHLAALDTASRHAAVVSTLSLAPAPIMLATLLVGFFYCLDALYSERRDRSILFWKSLPVSDFTTVLAKASIPLVVLPLIAFLLSLVTVTALQIASTVVLAVSGSSIGAFWSEVRLVQEPLVMIYGLAAHALWFAPIYGWLLVISAWARRTPLLWAALPPLVISVGERIVFGTSHIPSLLAYRISGAMTEAFVLASEHGDAGNIDQLSELSPARFSSSPGLWIGLGFAAACLAIAVRLRRTREPI